MWYPDPTNSEPVPMSQRTFEEGAGGRGLERQEEPEEWKVICEPVSPRNDIEAMVMMSHQQSYQNKKKPNINAGMGEGNPAVPALDKNTLATQECSE